MNNIVILIARASRKQSGGANCCSRKQYGYEKDKNAAFSRY
ncbi:MAG: hypothetical protein N2489_03440 [Clostridia bacterium]|nr:hypothetical protein [Clostridia bacterium]